MGYDNCPPLYNAYGAKTLRSKLVKKTKENDLIILGNLLTHSHWSIFTGDLPTHAHTGLFSRATCPDKKTWRIGRIVMGDQPKNGKKEEWSCCNG